MAKDYARSIEREKIIARATLIMRGIENPSEKEIALEVLFGQKRRNGYGVV